MYAVIHVEYNGDWECNTAIELTCIKSFCCREEANSWRDGAIIDSKVEYKKKKNNREMQKYISNWVDSLQFPPFADFDNYIKYIIRFGIFEKASGPPSEFYPDAIRQKLKNCLNSGWSNMKMPDDVPKFDPPPYPYIKYNQDNLFVVEIL